jgi:hypothetical protein
MKPPRIVPISLLALVVLCVTMSRPASADMIISNSGTVDTSGTLAADATPAIKSSYVAAGFTINAGSNYTFSDAIAYGIMNAGPPAGSGTIYAAGSLWMGTGSGPTTFVENLTTASVSGTTYTFDDTSGATLIGGETYWLIITTTKQQLRWIASTAPTTGPGASYVAAGQGLLTGSASSPSISSYSAGPGGVAGFEIDGTLVTSAVPEPASLTLFALGLAGTAASAIRRRLRGRAA